MTDDEKLEKAFNHIRSNQWRREEFLAHVERDEWELAADIVKGVLAFLGFVVSTAVNIVNAVANWFF